MPETMSYRQSLPLQPLDILRRAAAMGRTLVGVRHGGALLERIGQFDGVRDDGGWMVAEDAAHVTRIHLGRVAASVADRSETPHDTILAYVDLLDGEGRSLLKITALEGLDKLDAALDGLPRAPLPYVPPVERSAVPVDDADPGAAPLRAAQASGLPVTLSLTRPGAFQSRTGPITRVLIGHNYINVLEEDLHLHLRGDQVMRWDVERRGAGVRWNAVGVDGEPYGLAIEGEEAAFAVPQPA